MGSDLSVVMRTCAPVPKVVREALEQRRSSSRGGEESGALPMSYTEFRLVCGEIFNPEMLTEVSKGTATPPSIRLLVADTTPQNLSLLELEDAAQFPQLHDALRCKECLGRVGLVVDPSVRIGQRLYAAEQRHIFTQGFSMFLSKLVLAMKHVAPSSPEDWFLGVEDESPPAGNLVSTRQNSPSKSNSCVPHELFLLDLEQGLLDDVSGPWLVRDIVDHMGRVLHYHSAVSLLCGPSTPSPSMSRNILETPMSADTSSSSRVLARVFASCESTETPLPAADAAQLGFCRSLRHVLLAQNNMSRTGLRKCLLELLNNNEQEHGTPVRFLQMIDVRENEESEATQRFVSELSSYTGVQIIIGTSGKRWRHRAPYWANKGLPHDGVGVAGMMLSLAQGMPCFKANASDRPELNPSEKVELTPVSFVQQDQSRSLEKVNPHSVGNRSDVATMRPHSESGQKGAFVPHTVEQHNEESTKINAASDGTAAALETKGRCMGVNAPKNMSLDSFSLNEEEINEGDMDEERMRSLRLDAAGEAEAEAADDKELLDIHASLLADSPTTSQGGKLGPGVASLDALAATHEMKGPSAEGMGAVLPLETPVKLGSSTSSSYIVEKEEAPGTAKAVPAPPQLKKGVRPHSRHVPPAAQTGKSVRAPKRPQQQSRDATVNKEKNSDVRRQQRPGARSPPKATKTTSGKRGSAPSTLPARGRKATGAVPL
ncbi:uncharacterized protein Tco025E_03645 [Trypanosoma conorhini]|uniref:Uncharacterized protein n=1 Tax=Trypanosoma conorhini TaxID=83891 RepID=A0A422PTB4_9TRYP|nr:uncharacterized protein Tco025E_03645 [Trypanosoma conorhini]RNF20737.1 hypothetical protein Tco025E_03645 [Trypanosoma conorhini]